MHGWQAVHAELARRPTILCPELVYTTGRLGGELLHLSLEKKVQVR